MSKTAHTKEKTAIVRPPVICIMGHIDHGKSTLLDYIRKSNVAENEAGGITQHISAYEVDHVRPDGTKNKITFIDTPGHEAFSGMRERGASIADIAVLVVSAEDGVKKQTIEAYKAIEESKAPFVVAINKIDKPSADVERTKLSLAENGIYLEGYGGSISYVPVSAKTGAGIPELLDLLLLTAEISDLTADTSAPAEGGVVETTRDQKKGVSATVVIKQGSLASGMFVAADKSFAPTRMLENFAGKKITEATVSSPIRIYGWNEAPRVGARFRTFGTKKELEAYLESAASQTLAKAAAESAPTDKKVVPLVVKADTLGSVEAIQHELRKLSYERVSLRILYAGIGDVTESDVKLVSGAQDALIVSFNVKTDSQAQALIERLGRENATFNIIYKLTEWVDEKAKEKTPKIEVEETIGKAKILKFFSRTKDRQVVGGKVTDREVKLGHKVKILRRETAIGEGVIRELQQTKVKTSTVAEGFEFGAMIESKMELAPGDIIEVIVTVEK